MGLATLAAPLLGLVSALSWGAGDFCGGVASKRAPLFGVLVVGGASGVLVIAALALLAGEPAPPATSLGWGVAGGLSGAVGLGALYRGLAVGRMAIVAPISAVLSAALPVAWQALADGLPPPARLAGIGLALGGIWLVAKGDAHGVTRRELGLATLAGCGFGGFLVLMHAGAQGGTFWPLAAARATSVALVLATALALRSAWRPPRASLRIVVLSGLFDAGGNLFFVLAGRAGSLDVAAVLSSMYPASTVLLAAVLLRERVTRTQGAGVAALLTAIPLISG